MSYTQVYCVERIIDIDGVQSEKYTPEKDGKFEGGSASHRAEQALQMRDELNEKYANNNRWYIAVVEDY
ncbi:MAG: hypothetical protein GY861_04695 [bacterium]|nr:hypothetical protein [bacterium]